MPRLPLSLRKQAVESEADRIARYEPIQRQTCEMARAPFVAPDVTKLVWLGPTVPEGNRRIEGGRYAETDGWSGWSLIAADLPRPSPEEIQFEHLRHLVTLREDLMPYLGLPVGWTFEIFANGSWRAWSPKDRLLTWIPTFLDGSDATPAAAIAIAELISEQFAETDLASQVADPMLAWARAGKGAEAPTDVLVWARDWLEASGLR
jgi:hypothetical protein